MFVNQYFSDKRKVYDLLAILLIYYQRIKIMALPSPAAYDRFINSKPNPLSFQLYPHDSPHLNSYKDSNYSHLIKKNLFNHDPKNSQPQFHSPKKDTQSTRPFHITFSGNKPNDQDKNILSPVKILDVPNIRDDFYLNLIDWHQKGPIGIALNDQVYIYTPNDIMRLTKCVFNSYISSLKFNQSMLSVGVSNGMVEIYDLQKSSLLRTVKNHYLRISSLEFSQNLMISGSKDKAINLNDLRIKQSLVKSIQYHNGEVCTIKVKPDQPNMFASGANDSKVYIWDVRHNTPLSTIKGHKGAVKAISWCPWKSNTLATGGGKNDRTIKIWGDNMNLISQTETKSQLTGLQWNSTRRFLVSSHGPNSNEICLWNWDNESKLSKTNGSKTMSKRVLNLIQSKEEDMVCTLSSDQTMKFYQFPAHYSSSKQIFDTSISSSNSQRIL